MNSIHSIPGGVTSARGFQAACCAAGIKYEGRTDMAMIACEVPCEVAGTFTTNRVQAAPVIWDRDIVESETPVQAVVVNAGIANAATGEPGLALCRETAEYTGRALGISPFAVLVGSTGVIGPLLPADRLKKGIDTMVPALSGTREAGTQASRAIMTTDTVNKEYAVEFELPAASGKGSTKVHLGGMCKGSGMIHPNMCTMLAYLTTDCAISRTLLQKALSHVVQDTFNMISVDGDTSTNDTLLLFASALAGNAPIEQEDESYALFLQALEEVCRTLAVKMAADGEGATHLIEMTVLGADSKENARTLARSVVSSSLVKAMVFGKDANCGRILCALGYAGVDFDPADIEVFLHGEGETLCFYTGGRVQEFDEDKALQLLSGDKVSFSADMHAGTCEATAWGCDLTYDYVKINGDYRS